MGIAFANALLALALEFLRFQRATATATIVTSADGQIMRPPLRRSFTVTAALNGNAL